MPILRFCLLASIWGKCAEEIALTQWKVSALAMKQQHFYILILGDGPFFWKYSLMVPFVFSFQHKKYCTSKLGRISFRSPDNLIEIFHKSTLNLKMFNSCLISLIHRLMFLIIVSNTFEYIRFWLFGHFSLLYGVCIYFKRLQIVSFICSL